MKKNVIREYDPEKIYKHLYAHTTYGRGVFEKHYGELLDMHWPEGSSVIEWGSGYGEFLDYLRQNDCDAYGIDYINDESLQVPKSSTATVSVDFLEHLPEGFLADVIDEMLMTATDASLHIIYNGPDVWEVEGELYELHLTQRPQEWWVSQFRLSLKRLSKKGSVRLVPVKYMGNKRFMVRVDYE